MKDELKYSLKPSFLPREFDTIEDLVQYVLDYGVDPSYEIMHGGVDTGEKAVDFIIY